MGDCKRKLSNFTGSAIHIATRPFIAHTDNEWSAIFRSFTSGRIRVWMFLANLFLITKVTDYASGKHSHLDEDFNLRTIICQIRCCGWIDLNRIVLKRSLLSNMQGNFRTLHFYVQLSLQYIWTFDRVSLTLDSGTRHTGSFPKETWLAKGRQAKTRADKQR